MLPSGKNLSALFRTLAPEESSLDDVAKATAPSAGQEWPLFQVVTPTRPEPTPPLTPQERKRWGVQAAVRVEPPQPALSMAGLSSKLGQSLSQISERMVSEAAQPVNPALVRSAQPLGKSIQSAPDSMPSPKAGVSLFSKPSPVVKPDVLEEKGEAVALFEKPLVQPALVSQPAVGKVEVDDSLSGIFNRLEAGEKATVKPVEKRSSLSTRLGKR